MNKIIVNLENIKWNIKQIKKRFPNYQYYMAVVKSNAYGLGLEAIKEIANDCDYLVVANVLEATEIRNVGIKKPILVLEPIQKKQLQEYIDYSLTATVDNIDSIHDIGNAKIKVHMKINTGMNRFGFTSKEEIEQAVMAIQDSDLILEGIYTHLYSVDDKHTTKHQIDIFKEIVNGISYSFSIVHLFNSQALSECEKVDIANGVRIGDLLYGLTEHTELNLKSTFSLQTKVLSIRSISKGQTVGYDGLYEAKEDGIIAILPIGYSHGLTKNHIGTNVYIHNVPYPIIGNTMNSTFIQVDNTIHVEDTVEIYKDTSHMIELSKQLKTVPQEFMLILDKNIEKEYK